MKKVYWAFLLERCNYDRATDVVAGVSYLMGKLAANSPEMGWHPIGRPWQYQRTDLARQALALTFLDQAGGPDDTLVMFDIDHDHPARLAARLVADDKDVVAPLMFRRGEPYEACAFRRDRAGDNDIHHLAAFPPGLHRVDALGHGCIAIKRRAFQKILDAGLGPWFWKYEYLTDRIAPSEDIYFSRLCEQAGVEMWVDCDIETPHLALALVDKQTHDDYVADHPGRTVITIGPPAPELPYPLDEAAQTPVLLSREL